MKVEPTIDVRERVIRARQLFVALTDEGFTESQALRVIAAMLVANQSGEK